MSKNSILLLPFLCFLTGCTAIPAILSGPAIKDAIVSVEKGVQAIEDKDLVQKKRDEHEAIDESVDAVLETAEAVMGLSFPIHVDFWHEEDKKD